MMAHFPPGFTTRKVVTELRAQGVVSVGCAMNAARTVMICDFVGSDGATNIARLRRGGPHGDALIIDVTITSPEAPTVDLHQIEPGRFAS